jgi:glycosyltransferase involved in cell wall biosynthesis
MSRVMVAVKTTEGGRWILPQIDSLRRRGAEVVVLLPEGEGRLATEVTALVGRDTGVHLVRSPFDFGLRVRFGVLAELLALRRLVAAAEVDCVLYHLYATALAIRLTTCGLRLRRVHMIAGPLFLESPVIALVERLLWRLDSHIICGSRYIFQRYRALGVPSHRMSVVPYGVDTTLFEPSSAEQRAAARRKLDLPADGLVAVMVSYVYAPKRLAHRGQAIKGHEVLLQAWQDFHRQHPEATLLLVGSGFDAAGEQHRQDLMRRFGYEAGKDGVIWLDSVHDVRVAYRCADVSISPSLSDNHGAVLEASAMGLPCIVSDAGALAEAVENGVGWVHRAGSPEDLQRCLEECARARALAGLRDRGDASRRFILAHFDQQSSTEKVADQVCGGIDTGQFQRV